MMLASRSLVSRHLGSRPVCQPCRVPAPAGRTPLRVTAMATPIVIEKLKRAPSAYNLFYKAKYAEVKTKLTTQKGSATLADCSKALYSQWSSLSAAQKAPFEKEAAVIKEKFETAKANGTLISKTKKDAKAKGPPKAPNAYAIFMKESFAGLKAKKPTASVTEIAKDVAALWKSMSDSQKAAYKAKADKLKAAAPAAPAAAPKAATKAASQAPGARPASAAPTKTASPPAAVNKARSATPVKKSTPTK